MGQWHCEAEDIEAVKLACDGVVEYAAFFEQSAPSQADSSRSLEDQFFEREAHLNKLAFLQQVHFHNTVHSNCSFTLLLCTRG